MRLSMIEQANKFIKENDIDISEKSMKLIDSLRVPNEVKYKANDIEDELEHY